MPCICYSSGVKVEDNRARGFKDTEGQEHKKGTVNNIALVRVVGQNGALCVLVKFKEPERRFLKVKTHI